MLIHCTDGLKTIWLWTYISTCGAGANYPIPASITDRNRLRYPRGVPTSTFATGSAGCLGCGSVRPCCLRLRLSSALGNCATFRAKFGTTRATRPLSLTTTFTFGLRIATTGGAAAGAHPIRTLNRYCPSTIPRVCAISELSASAYSVHIPPRCICRIRTEFIKKFRVSI